MLAITVYDDGTGPALYAGGRFTSAWGVEEDLNHIAKWDGSMWLPLGTGVNDRVESLFVYDDGTGPALYAGGKFTNAGGQSASRIARWDGTSWSALGEGVCCEGSSVYAFAVFDDGSGPALFVGGSFTKAGGDSSIDQIAKWDGRTWSAVGSGLGDTVNALLVADLGAGPALYAGGRFDEADEAKANRVAQWDGKEWSPLAAGVNDDVRALAVVGAGNDAVLYVGGEFTLAGGVEADHIASWNGENWSALGSGPNADVTAMAVLDDGAGPILYVGGEFETVACQEASRIARWICDQPVEACCLPEGGCADVVASECVCQGGNANGPGTECGTRECPAIEACCFSDGSCSDVIASYCESLDGEPLGSDTVCANSSCPAPEACCLADGSCTDVPPLACAGADGTAQGPETVCASSICPQPVVACCLPDGACSDTTENECLAQAGTPNELGSACRDETCAAQSCTYDWQPGYTYPGTGDPVHALTSFDDGSGPALFVAGEFYNVPGDGDFVIKHIARWDGVEWHSLGPGLSATPFALAVFDDGSGPALYVAGGFTGTGDDQLTLNNIGKWDGTQWSPLADGVDGTVNAMEVFDDGNGAALYVVGEFISVGGIGAWRVAKWDGQSWSAVGEGIQGEPGQTVLVYAIQGFDAFNGPELFVGGDFCNVGDGTADHVVRWDGDAWIPAGSDFNSAVRTFEIFDDGNGARLYAGGQFDNDNGLNKIARWDGVNWTGVAGADDTVVDLHVFDDGSGNGEQLIAVGRFLTAGGLEVNSVASWDGSEWSPLGTGTDTKDPFTITDHDDGNGPAVYVGGDFRLAGDVLVEYVGRWDGEQWSSLGQGADSSVRVFTNYDDGTGPALFVGGSFSRIGGVVARWASRRHLVFVGRGTRAGCPRDR